MEHDDRPAVATFIGDGALVAGTVITLGEGATHHARVKRLEPGDIVRVADGAGQLGSGPIEGIRKASLDITIERIVNIAAPSPIHLRVPAGDRDRMLWLAEKATELGIASWQVVRFQRSASVSPRGEGPQFAEKVRMRMVSALEQSGGAWLPRVLPDATVNDIAAEGSDLRVVLDARGEPLPSLLAGSALAAPVILFGPEGGIEAHERAALDAGGWRAARLAGTTLRFETAGIAAVAVLRAAQMLTET